LSQSIVNHLIRAWVGIAVLVSLGVSAAEAPVVPSGPASETSTNAAPAQSFLRFEKTGSDEGIVQTAVKTYARADGVEVTLFAAVHVADRGYYRKLEELFQACDALLYEMVREQGAEISELEMTANPVSQLQIFMKNVMDLEFQLEAVDYRAPNFVHADLDPTTFFRLQEERGESMLGLMLQAVLEEQSRQAANPDQAINPFQLLFVLMSKDRAHGLKFLLGQQMNQIEMMLAGIDKGVSGEGSVLVSGRNEHAVKVLTQQIAKGRKRLGIFYGAGHMPDFERRLNTMGFHSIDEEWLTAWDIRRGERSEPGEAAPTTPPH